MTDLYVRFKHAWGRQMQLARRGQALHMLMDCDEFMSRQTGRLQQRRGRRRHRRVQKPNEPEQRRRTRTERWKRCGSAPGTTGKMTIHAALATQSSCPPLDNCRNACEMLSASRCGQDTALSYPACLGRVVCVHVWGRVCPCLQ